MLSRKRGRGVTFPNTFSRTISVKGTKVSAKEFRSLQGKKRSRNANPANEEENVNGYQGGDVFDFYNSYDSSDSGDDDIGLASVLEYRENLESVRENNDGEKRPTQHAITQEELRHNWAEIEDELADALIEYAQGKVIITEENFSSHYTVTTWDKFEGPKVIDMAYALSERNVNVNLIRRGYLGNAPIHPSVAFSLRTLRDAACAQNRADHSLNAFVQTLFDQLDLPHTKTLYQQFLNTYYIFLTIGEIISKRGMEIVRAYEKEHGRALEGIVCPACHHKASLYITYELMTEGSLQSNGEGSLNPAYCFSLDCNMSQKRYAKCGTADTRTFNTSKYLVKPETVERFAHDHEGQDAPSDKCSANFKAAKNIKTDLKSNAPFEQTGIGTACCRHGFCLCYCDLIRSGELRKYGLAMLEYVVGCHGERGRCGYDIGCDFASTLRNSILSDECKNVTMVNALMHSFAHDWLCQLQYNPRRLLAGIDGMTDYEDNERLYKFLNGSAATGRVSSKFHRAQKLERQIDLYNADHLMNLGTNLASKYNNAIKTLELADKFLEERPAKYTDLSVLEALRTEEIAFLKGERDAGEVLFTKEELYVKELQKLEDLKTEHAAKRKVLLDLYKTESDEAVARGEKGQYTKEITGASKEYYALGRRIDTLAGQLGELEAEFSPNGERWELDDPKIEIILERERQKEFTELKRKVQIRSIARVLEFEKAGLANTCYKMRSKIAKNINDRSDTLYKAIQQCNRAAQRLKIDFRIDGKKVFEATVLGELDFLLRDENIQDKLWMQPLERKLLEKLAEKRCAENELVRLGVEIPRVFSYLMQREQSYGALIMGDEMQHFDGVRNVDGLKFQLKIEALKFHNIKEKVESTLGEIVYIARQKGYTDFHIPAEEDDFEFNDHYSTVLHQAQVIFRNAYNFKPHPTFDQPYVQAAPEDLMDIDARSQRSDSEFVGVLVEEVVEEVADGDLANDVDELLRNLVVQEAQD